MERAGEKQQQQHQVKMLPAQRSTRINLQDFKSKFLKILGPAKENQYWMLLTSFLSFKLTKAELDKLIPSTIGKENVVLHNQFVRAIFSNASCSDAPAPPPSSHDTSKPVKGVRRKPLGVPSVVSTDEPGGPASSPGAAVSSRAANGDAAVPIPSSPRKGRSAIRDRKAGKERPSPLGFHHRGEASTSQGGSVLDEETSRGLENGGVVKPDLSRPDQKFPYAASHSNSEQASPDFRAAKRARQATTPSSILGVNNNVITGREENDEEEEEDYSEEDDAELGPYGIIRPPLGIPFCIASVGAPRRVPFMGVMRPLTHSLLGEGLRDECLEGTDLPDGEGLQRRMRQVAVTENGLQGVSMDAANLVNRALDVYLKRLLKPTVELCRAGRSSSRSREKQQVSSKEDGGVGFQGKDLRKDTFSPAGNYKQINGIWPVHGSTGPRDAIGVGGEAAASYESAEKFGSTVISPLDFKVAMETNPQLLGQEWPTLMEKISLRVFDQ